MIDGNLQFKLVVSQYGTLFGLSQQRSVCRDVLLGNLQRGSIISFYNEVFPEPLAPSTTQCSPGAMVQWTSDRIEVRPRKTVRPVRRRMGGFGSAAGGVGRGMCGEDARGKTAGEGGFGRGARAWR